jgi:NAD+ kinase
VRFQKAASVIDKKYTISRRTLLSLTCTPSNEAIEEINFAMNEITVSRKRYHLYDHY